MPKATLHYVKPHLGESEEPTWQKVERKDYNSQLSRGLNWHNHCAETKDYRKYIERWIREWCPKTVKEDLASLNKVADKDLDKTTCKMARMHLQGFPMNLEHNSRINDYVKTIRAVGKKAKKEASKNTTVIVPDIQARMRQQVVGTLSDLDAAIDSSFDGELSVPAKLAEEILAAGYKGPQLKFVVDYLKRNISEWQEALDETDEQLVEGYAYVGRGALKKIVKVYSEVLDIVSHHHTKIKATRIIKKRPIDKRKMALKVKFLEEDTSLGLKSIDPIDIIGANMLWVYDTKKRLLGYYEGESTNSLHLRGSMVDGFKVTCVKILRKPAEQLAVFTKLRKNQTANFLESIKAKCKTFNGRTNKNLLLLRVD